MNAYEILTARRKGGKNMNEEGQHNRVQQLLRDTMLEPSIPKIL